MPWDALDQMNMACLRECLACLLEPPELDSTIQALCRHMGGFSAVMYSSGEALASVPGVSPKAAHFICQTLELARCCMRDISDSQEAPLDFESYCRLLRAELMGQRAEAAAVVLTDRKMRRIYSGILQQGAFSRTNVCSIHLTSLCLRFNAAFLIFAHNHPASVPFPSVEDVTGTVQLLDGLDTVGIGLWDHVIFAGGEVFSFAKSGLLKEMRTAAVPIRMRRMDWAREIAQSYWDGPWGAAAASSPARDTGLKGDTNGV